MLKFTTNGKNGKRTLCYPTNLNELTPEFLSGITSGITVADNYSLICICYREKLHNIILTAKQNKASIDTPVVPIFVKSGNSDSSTPCNAETGNKIIISASQIATGYHVNVIENTLTINNLLNSIDGDGMAYQHALTHNDKYVYFVEFKLVPNCDIVGLYSKNTASYDNPFKIEDKE